MYQDGYLHTDMFSMKWFIWSLKTCKTTLYIVMDTGIYSNSMKTCTGKDG